MRGLGKCNETEQQSLLMKKLCKSGESLCFFVDITEGYEMLLGILETRGWSLQHHFVTYYTLDY